MKITPLGPQMDPWGVNIIVGIMVHLHGENPLPLFENYHKL